VCVRCPKFQEVPTYSSALQMNAVWGKLTSSACSRKEQAGASQSPPSVVLDCILSSHGCFSTVHGGTLHTGESVAVKTFVVLNG
jgi:hypothetical protein